MKSQPIKNSQSLSNPFHSLLPLPLSGFSREDLKAYFLNAWELYEMLFNSIPNDNTLYLNPDPLRQPLIFYKGHTAVFYIHKLKMAGYERPGIDNRLESLLARGVDPSDPEDLTPNPDWPSAERIREYRNQAKNWVLDFIQNVELRFPVVPESPLWALFMAIEHDRIHWETSSVLIRQYPLSLVRRPEGYLYAPTEAPVPVNDFISVTGGPVRIGKRPDSVLWGWDNEYGELNVVVQPFQASRYCISNLEFMRFVEADGYRNPEYWTEEGWTWKKSVNANHPKFWVPAGEGQYEYRAMFDQLPLPLSWPAEVNCHEAIAFCKWKGEGIRLLSEAEYRFLADKVPLRTPDPMFENRYNLNLRFGSPTPVGFLPEGKSPDGFCDLYGNVWQWLRNDFYPLPGFKPHYLFEDFSVDYMDTEHSMLLGGSWASSGTSGSRDYRLWFRRQFFQHAGFRISRSLH